MAWHRVQIDLGDDSVDAMMFADKSQLRVANVIEVGDSIKVDKKKNLSDKEKKKEIKTLQKKNKDGRKKNTLTEEQILDLEDKIQE